MHSYFIILSEGDKGLYVSAYGGLPLFSSGNRVDAVFSASKGGWLIRFSEPCDPSHVQIVRSSSGSGGGSISGSRQFPRLRCSRSKELIGWLNTTDSGKVLDNCRCMYLYVYMHEHLYVCMNE